MDDVEFLKDYFQQVINKLRSNLEHMRDSRGNNRYASTMTAQSVAGTDGSETIKITKTDQGVVLDLYMPDYYDYINKGVQGLDSSQNRGKGSKYSFRKPSPPPLFAMRKFMFNRGIVPKNKEGKRLPTRGNYEKMLNSLAYAIGVKLKQTGIEPFPFYDNVINDRWLDKLVENLSEIYGQELVASIETVRVNNDNVT